MPTRPITPYNIMKGKPLDFFVIQPIQRPNMNWMMHVGNDMLSYFMNIFQQNVGVHDSGGNRAPSPGNVLHIQLSRTICTVCGLCYLLYQHYAISPSMTYVSLWICGGNSSLFNLFTEGRGSDRAVPGSGLDLNHSDRLSQSLGRTDRRGWDRL